MVCGASSGRVLGTKGKRRHHMYGHCRSLLNRIGMLHMIDPESDFILGLDENQRETLKAMLSMGPATMQRLIKIAEEDKQREWLFSLIRKGAAWVFGIVAALVVFRDNLAALLGIGRP